MDWQSGRRSDNVEDRRGGVGRKLTLSGGAVVLVVVVGALLGKSPQDILHLITQSDRPPVAAPAPGSPGTNDVGSDFVRSVLGSTEDVWDELFREGNSTYLRPKLVLFRQGVDSACGVAESAIGPFYCPADEKVYLDLDFFDDLDRRFHAPGEFARAYVIAHEVGHHVQNVLGWEKQRRQAAAGRSRAEQNALSVRTELQADCLAGVWAFHASHQRPFLERGDLESALGAASAIGDDRLQRQQGGGVAPETFTHGTSEQRVRWFRRGLESGDPERCNTFDVPEP
jgi:predicted metalloprotease